MNKTLYCQNCPETEAEYLWKDGKDYIPVCEMCASKWALEYMVDNNEVIDINDLEDEELEEFEEKYGK